MKILNIIALFLFIGIKAQTSINGVVLYQETFKSTLGNVNSNYELYFNKNHSIYLFSGNSTQTETNSDGKFSKFIPQRSSDPPFYYKKLNKKEDKILQKEEEILDEVSTPRLVPKTKSNISVDIQPEPELDKLV